MPEYLSVSSPAREVSSAPHSRSCSFKKRPNNLEVLSSPRPRTNSMPNCQSHHLAVPHMDYNEYSSIDERICRIRSFRTTAKGVENNGDSFKRHSTNSLMSSGSTVTDYEKQRSSSITSEDSQTNSGVSWVPSYFRVALIGSNGVGKSAISRQFLTSEYVGYDVTTPENEEQDTTVSVLLDGEESIMEFTEDPQVTDLENLHVDAFIVAFSITDYSSFVAATSLIQHLRVTMGTDRTILLVANKIDLVRQRKVTAKGARDFAIKYDCDYRETSAVLNHHVDDLLVASLKQIRIKLSPPSEEKKNSRRHSIKSCSDKLTSPRKALALFTKFLNLHTHKSRSCNNLLAF
ncbi:GTP-binding protein GEM [Patella vulgata]|uniref:GTP-binding protein GEM n=1 Tax=Patella vulgata TaxID=6465 RepID=UPI00217FEBFA|nr:GTP-binding protein GEM [Patella vulgata]